MRSLNEQIAHLKLKIADLAAKEEKYKNRRLKEEQKLKSLLRRLKTQRDSLYLTALRHLIDNDPEELAKLQKTLDQLDLSNDDRALVDLPAKDTRSATTDVPDSGSDTPSPTPRSPANNSGGDALQTQDQDRTPAAAPNTAPDTAAATPSLTTPVDRDTVPSQPKAPNAAANASLVPGDKPTEKQLTFLKDLIAKSPDKAQKIGIDSESLSTLSKQKTSWAIQQLKPARKATPLTSNRR